MNRLSSLLLTLLVVIALPGCEKIERTVFDAEMSIDRSMNGLEAGSTTVDDIQWAYLKNEWKDGQPVVVLLHGFSADKGNWPRFVGALGDGYNVLVPDLPGHGETTRDPKLAYDIDTQARRLLSLMTALGVEKFHLAGNSMGGAISARAAWLAPGRVLTLGLINSAGVHKHPSEFDAQLKDGNNPLIVSKPGDMENVIAWAMAQPPFAPWPVLSVMEREGIARAELNRKIFVDLRRDNGIDQSKILPEIAVPTLVLWGDKDRLLNVANAAEFTALMPDARAVIMAGIGHAPMLEDPAESARIYREFLAGR